MKEKNSTVWFFILIAIIILMIIFSLWKKNEKFSTPEIAKYYR